MDTKFLNSTVYFLGIFFVNTVLLLVLSIIFADNVVLGNSIFSKYMAAVLSGFLITFVGFFASWQVENKKLKLEGKKLWALYLAVNLVAIWIIKRLAALTGLGISGNVYTLILAAIFVGVQVLFKEKIKPLIK